MSHSHLTVPADQPGGEGDLVRAVGDLGAEHESESLDGAPGPGEGPGHSPRPPDDGQVEEGVRGGVLIQDPGEAAHH